MSFQANKTYDVSVKFLADRDCRGVTLKIDDNTAMVFDNQSINLKAGEEYTHTQKNIVGVAGNNNIMVFDFGYAATGTHITVSDISVVENAGLDNDTEAPKDVTVTVTSSYISATVAVRATDNSGLVSYSVTDGDSVVATGSGLSGAETLIPITGLTPSTQYNYTVVASDASGNRTEGVPATVNTLALTAAPAPEADADKVFSLYSDAYTPAAAWVMGSWGQSTIGTDGLIAENEHAFVCTTADYMGWEINGNQPIDVTAYPFLSMDIYAPKGGAISFTPVWSTETLRNYPLKSGWNTIDIDLAKDFTGINLAGIIQLKWADMPETCVLDNVYFHREISTGLYNPAAPAAARKRIENGQVVIVRGAERYNVLGQTVK